MTIFRLSLCIFVMAIAGALVAGPPPRQAPAAAPAGNKDNGKKIYVSYGCYQCHGLEAQGADATGPRLGPSPIPYARFLSYVRKPAGSMPPYTVKSATDQEMADIYAFIQAQPRPPALSSIPLLQ